MAFEKKQLSNKLNSCDFLSHFKVMLRLVLFQIKYQNNSLW